MPFVGELRGETVVPEEVDEPVTCLECGGELGIRESHERNGTFVARHFWHISSGGGCSGGESYEHRRMKSIALSKIKNIFPCREAGLERKIGSNIADVYAIFERPLGILGKGVVAEIQHKNEDKDRNAVTINYLEEGFTVYWLDQSNFSGYDVEFGEAINPKQRFWRKPAVTEAELFAWQDSKKCPICETKSPEETNYTHYYEGEPVYECQICSVYLIEGAGGDLRTVSHRSHLDLKEGQLDLSYL